MKIETAAVFVEELEKAMLQQFLHMHIPVNEVYSISAKAFDK